MSVPIITLMMGTEMVSEMQVVFNKLTQLTAQEDFINVSCCESFTSYKYSQNPEIVDRNCSYWQV
jgi:hypothetical protein